jgi:hypothetical protein
MADETEPKKEDLVDTLILTLDRRTMTLGFNGDVWEKVARKEENAFDILFTILDLATRQADVQYRIINGIKAQQAIKAMQEDFALRERLSRGQN